MSIATFWQRWSSVPSRSGLGFADDDAKAGLLSTVFFISYALFSPVVGWLGDRVTRKYLIAGGVAVWSLATFASGWTQNYHQMLAGLCSILGIGEALACHFWKRRP